MSKTDKTDPWWVAAQWWEPQHFRCANAHGRGWVGVRHRRECDLPAAPVRQHPSEFTQRRCRWVPSWPSRGRYLSCPAPPKWFIDHVSTEPTRRRVRDDCRQAIKEYRATGKVDVIPPVDQHRHCAQWLWW